MEIYMQNAHPLQIFVLRYSILLTPGFHEKKGRVNATPPLLYRYTPQFDSATPGVALSKCNTV